MIAQTVPSSAPQEWPELPPVTLPATGSDPMVLLAVAFALFVLAAAAFLVRNRLRP